MKTGKQSDLIKYLKSEYGKECTRAAISKLVKVKDYRIQFTPGGKIIIDKSAKALFESGFPRMQANKKKYNAQQQDEDVIILKNQVETGNVAGFETIDPPGSPSADQDYLLLEKIKLYEQARKLHIQNNIEEGRYILAETAQSDAFDAARKARNILQGLAPRIRSIVPDKIRHEVEQLVTREVNNALNLLADYCVTNKKDDHEKRKSI